jgi:hypothetical protein
MAFRALTSEALHGLVAIALFALPGLGLTELFPGLRAMPAARRLAYGYLLGIGAVAGALYALSHLFGVPLRRPAVLAVAAVPIVAGLLARAIGGPARRRRPLRARAGRVHAAVIAVTAAIGLGVFLNALTDPLIGWDSRMTWAAQARYVRDAGTVDPVALLKPQWFITHPRYPLLLPVAQVAVLETLHAGDDAQPYRALYAAMLPAFLILLHGAARRRAGLMAADLTVLAAAALPFLTFHQDGGATSGYNDLPLALFAGAALLLLLEPRPRVSDGVAAGLLLASAVLTKNEGTLLAGFVLIAAAWVPALRLLRRPARRARRRPWLSAARLGAAAALVLAAVAFFAAWRSGIPNRQDEMYEDFVDAGRLWPSVITRLPTVLPMMAQRMSIPDHWWQFWWVALLVALAGIRGLAGRRCGITLPLLVAALAPMAVAWGAYSVHWDPVGLAKVTWERFLVQGSLPLLLLLALALREAIRRSALSGLARFWQEP